MGTRLSVRSVIIPSVAQALNSSGALWDGANIDFVNAAAVEAGSSEVGGGGGGGTATDSGVLVDISSFDPSALRGLQTWLKADVGVTESSGAVSAWADQSSNGFSFAQGTASQQPTLVASAYNSLPCIRFDAANDQILRVLANEMPSTLNHTFFAVLKSDDATGSAHVFGLGEGTQPDDERDWGMGLYISSGKYGLKMVYNTSTGISLSQQSAASTSLALVSGSLGKRDSWLRVNGTLEAEDTDDLATTNYSYTSVGAGDGDGWGTDIPFDGDVCEIIHYNRAMPQSEIEAVEKYLENRWGL